MVDHTNVNAKFTINVDDSLATIDVWLNDSVVEVVVRLACQPLAFITAMAKIDNYYRPMLRNIRNEWGDSHVKLFIVSVNKVFADCVGL